MEEYFLCFVCLQFLVAGGSICGEFLEVASLILHRKLHPHIHL